MRAVETVGRVVRMDQTGLKAIKAVVSEARGPG